MLDNWLQRALLLLVAISPAVLGDFIGVDIGTDVHSLSLGGSYSGNSTGVFCVPKKGADAEKLKNGLNWACGEGHANCTDIQQGQPCYNPDTLQSHASYVFNDYYQRMHSVGGTCNFNGTAIITASDPSYGSCVYTGR